MIYRCPPLTNHWHGITQPNTSCDRLGALLAQQHTATPPHNQTMVKIEQNRQIVLMAMKKELIFKEKVEPDALNIEKKDTKSKQ
jgi:hypothetical protein